MSGIQTAWPASRMRDPDFPNLLAEKHPLALELYWAAAKVYHPYWQEIQEAQPLLTNSPIRP